MGIDEVEGVTFSGFVFEPTGYGEASRRLLCALHSRGVPLNVTNLSSRQFLRDDFIRTLLSSGGSQRYHLFHSEPRHAKRLRKIQGRRPILLTAWETDTFPAGFVGDCNQAGEVWVSSQHNVEVLNAALSVPVIKVPFHASRIKAIPSDPSFVESIRVPSDAFVFYSEFAWQARKNPVGMIEAFFRAFPTEEYVFLVLKTNISLAEGSEELRELRSTVSRSAFYSASARRRLIVVNGIRPEEQMTALLERANCYISLHRGEGWGYTLFDAACLGKPIVTTGYSGVLEYLTSNDARLIRFRMVPVSQSYEGFDSCMKWADPDLDEATAAMRDIYERYETESIRGLSRIQKLERQFNGSAVAGYVMDRLAHR